MRKKLFAVSLVAAAAVCFLYHSPVKISGKNEKFRTSEKPIPNRYIVVLNDTDESGNETEPNTRANEHARGFSMRVDKIYGSALKGYSAEMSQPEAVRLSEDPKVKYVEQDSAVELQQSQTNATWGISRIDQRDYVYPLDQNYTYPNSGAGVHAYVLDTGVLTTHPDFGGRATEDFNSTGDNSDIANCNGHGTHVAGIIGSSTYGVAKSVRLHSIRVYPCWSSGTMSNILSGIDWVARHAIRPAVANMSFAGAVSSTLDSAVQNLINSGVSVSVAAGNYADDACRYSPSRLPDAITVGSMTQTDSRDQSTNYGGCIDLFAPGVLITSTWNEPGMPTNTISGTSMAAPHAAGVAALYLASNPTASPRQVAEVILQTATTDRVYNVGQGSPNLLLFSSSAVGTEPPPVPPPPPTGCAGNEFAGSLAQPGGSNYQSSSSGFTGGSGTYSGRLQVPEGATFVLYLEQKKGKSWATVASSSGTSSTEKVGYRGRSGSYRWRIRSVDGVGSYSLCSVIP